MPKLGLTTSLGSSGLTTPGIVTDNLVMKHMYPAGAVQPLSDGAAYFVQSADSNIDMKMYHDREFKRIIERYESNRLTGPRVLSSGNHAIR